MESSANWYRRVRMSSAVMSLVVGRGAHFRGPSSGQTGRSACGGFPCDVTTEDARQTTAQTRRICGIIVVDVERFGSVGTQVKAFVHQRTRRASRSFHQAVDQETRLLQSLTSERTQELLHLAEHGPEPLAVSTGDDIGDLLRCLEVGLRHRRGGWVLHLDRTVEIR